MPTYQYACTECGHAFEQFQSFSDDALTECPQCQGRLRKVFNAVGVVFKGSGFYRNDSRDKKPAAASSDGKSETKVETKSDAKVETKSEPKADKKSETKAPATKQPACYAVTSNNGLQFTIYEGGFPSRPYQLPTYRSRFDGRVQHLLLAPISVAAGAATVGAVAGAVMLESAAKGPQTTLTY